MIARVGDTRRQPDPAPEEILAATLVIQRGWDDDTRAARCVGHIDVHWSLPEVGLVRPAHGSLDESQDIHDDDWR